MSQIIFVRIIRIIRNYKNHLFSAIFYSIRGKGSTFQSKHSFWISGLDSCKKSLPLQYLMNKIKILQDYKRKPLLQLHKVCCFTQKTQFLWGVQVSACSLNERLSFLIAHEFCLKVQCWIIHNHSVHNLKSLEQKQEGEKHYWQTTIQSDAVLQPVTFLAFF